MRILFVRKENKNNFIQQFFSSKSRLPPLSRRPLHVNNGCVWCCWRRTRTHGTLNNDGISWFGEKMLNKVVIFVFFVHKKYSHSFIKSWLNHWCHMDYFNDVLTTFLDLGTFQLHCCLRRVRELSDLIKNILICVPKMNESLGTTWRWVTGFLFLGELSL